MPDLTDQDMLRYTVRALCYTGLAVSIVVHAIWWRFAAHALIEHMRDHHPAAWRAAGGPVTPDEVAEKGWHRISIERGLAGGRAVFYWMRSVPHEAEECDDFAALSRNARLAFRSFLSTSILLLVVAQIWG